VGEVEQQFQAATVAAPAEDAPAEPAE